MTIETANRLYELRKKHGLSQEELAEKLGVSRQAVSKWERSEASPDTDNLIALAKIYGLSLDELIFGEKKSEENSEPTSNDKKAENKVDIGPAGIFVESADGDKVQIIGFGTFETKEQAAREGRNPATGEKLEIGACKRLAFSASQALKDKLNA